MGKNMRSVLIDIGGSYAKSGYVDSSGVLQTYPSKVILSKIDLVKEIRHIDPAPEAILLSVAGTVDVDGHKIFQSRALPWIVGDISQSLRQAFGESVKVKVINDADAHGKHFACRDDVKLGALVISLGTGIAFSVIDREANLTRTLSGTNWEMNSHLIGSPPLDPKKYSNYAGLALGGAGLNLLISEYGHYRGYEIYGEYLGLFITEMSDIFMPASVCLSGGLTHFHWDRIKDVVVAKLQDLDKYHSAPELLASDNRETALLGLMSYAKE